MPFTLDDIIEERVLCQLAPQVSYNILHAKITAQVGAGATETEVVDDASVRWAAIYKPCLSNVAAYYGADCKRIQPGPAGFTFTSKSGNGFGTVIGDVLPKQTTGLVTLVSTLPGRSGRGRIYIPFPSEFSNEVNGTPSAAYMAALEAFCTLWETGRTIVSLVNPGATTTVRYGVFSQLLQLFSVAANAICKDVWATQRRRGDYGNANVPPF